MNSVDKQKHSRGHNQEEEAQGNHAKRVAPDVGNLGILGKRVLYLPFIYAFIVGVYLMFTVSGDNNYFAESLYHGGILTGIACVVNEVCYKVWGSKVIEREELK